MKIETGTSNLYVGRHAQPPAAGRADPASFASVLGTTVAASSKSDAADDKRPDFSSMTRQEMREWTNEQIRAGKMSLDDSRPFMAMTMSIPVAGGAVAGNDGERVDFTRKIRAGIEGALGRNDDVTRKMLESAMTLMQQYQRA